MVGGNSLDFDWVNCMGEEFMLWLYHFDGLFSMGMGELLNFDLYN